MGGIFRITTPEFRMTNDGSGSLTCCAVADDGTCAALTCSDSISSDRIVLSFTGHCASAECPAATYTFRVTSGLQNEAFVVSEPDADWLFETTDSTGFVINSGELSDDDVTPVLPVALDPVDVSVGRADPATLSLSGQSYTFGFTTTSAVPSDGYFIILLDLNQVVTVSPACQTAVCTFGSVRSSPPQ